MPQPLSLRYVKYIDKSIAKKLDSFFIALRAKPKAKGGDSGFIKVDIYRYAHQNRNDIIADMNTCTQYCDYVSMVTKRVHYSNVIGFAFCNANLILFTMPYTKTRDEFVPLLRDLIYPEIYQFVKVQIDTNANEYKIARPFLVKRYSWVS